MARYRFNENKEYAGRLHAVRCRPVENAGLRLIRLEFEIFQFLQADRLSSTGKIACRDIVVGRGIDLSRDTAAMPYVAALRVEQSQSESCWLDLENHNLWVKILFGSVKDLDERNAFNRITPLDVNGFKILEYDYDLDSHWVTVSVAADDLGRSEATIRRLVDRAEEEFGQRVVRRTAGKHRRINLRLLRNLE